MSAEEYLKRWFPNDHPTDKYDRKLQQISWDSCEEIMESYAREYHAKEMQRKLETVHGPHIEEAGFYSMRNQANSYDKRYGFIKGAQWLLTHLKEQNG